MASRNPVDPELQRRSSSEWDCLREGGGARGGGRLEMSVDPQQLSLAVVLFDSLIFCQATNNVIPLLNAGLAGGEYENVVRKVSRSQISHLIDWTQLQQ